MAGSRYPKEAPVVARLEIHRHANIHRSGEIIHSHDEGARPHQHAGYGPATYTIDKDEWARATGLKGGGRKKFSAAPTGQQLPIVELESWQRSFEIIVDEESLARFHRQHPGATGGGEMTAARMILGSRMTATVKP
jgi:hypothetical protein